MRDSERYSRLSSHETVVCVARTTRTSFSMRVALLGWMGRNWGCSGKLAVDDLAGHFADFLGGLIA